MYAEAIDLRAIWRALTEDPEAPDRAELTEFGEVIVSPLPANRHQLVIGLVVKQLSEQLGGYAIPDLAVLTKGAGVRCPDVAWLPEDRLSEALNVGPLESAPPLVVEVLSPGNYQAQIAHKIRAYLETGVQEVVVVGLLGEVTFHRRDGQHAESAMSVKFTLPTPLFDH